MKYPNTDKYEYLKHGEKCFIHKARKISKRAVEFSSNNTLIFVGYSQMEMGIDKRAFWVSSSGCLIDLYNIGKGA